MYRYFLGAFGNKSFIRPQYEIMEDGKLRGIEDRWGEFPNGGTFSLTGISDSDTESIKNRSVLTTKEAHDMLKMQ